MYKIRIPIAIAIITTVSAFFYIDYRTETPYATSVLIGSFLLGALWEFYQMAKNRDYAPYQYYGLIGCCIALIIEIIYPQIFHTFDFSGLLMLGAFIIFLTQSQEERALENCAITVFGIIYIYFLMVYLIRIRHLGQGLDGIYYMFMVVFVAKSMDMGGYLIGKAFGKHKIAPNISPKKSVEGTIGGIIFAVGMAFLLREWMPILGEKIIWQYTIVFAVIIGIFSLLGDFVESLIKRRCDVKDSNQLIPEFGGFLDIVDSLLLIAPLGYYFFVFVLKHSPAT